MAFLALDLSKTSTGWALWDHGWDHPRYGHWVLGSEYTSRGATYAKLHQNLIDLRRVMARFEHIFYEEPINPGQLKGHTTINTITLAIGLAEHVESFSAAMPECSAQAINIQTWRTEFLGSDITLDAKREARARSKIKGSRVSARDKLKRLTVERCIQLGFSPQCDDEADALGILDYKLAQRGIQAPWRLDETLRPMSEVR